MPISKESLRGYILEEVLAFLIRRTGYKLLVDRSQDTRDLDHRGNGLVVKGRGGVHQVDVLGQLEWIPAFTFPLRLFIEAKFRKQKTGINVVRNAIGVVLDINQNNSPIREEGRFLQRYHYAYAIFSTSGFSKHAVDMALAHQISLIDLSGEDFRQLRGIIRQAARDIKRRIEGNANFMDREIDGDELDDQIDLSREKIVTSIRYVLRRELGTMPLNVESQYPDDVISNLVEPVVSVAKGYDELLVAMANGPFMLVLKADNPGAFIRYATDNPRHKVNIHWDRMIDDGQTWLVNPADGSSAYSLSFKLPEILKSWVFETSENTRKRAFQAKQEFLSVITIYRLVEGKDQLFRLEFDAESTRRYTDEINRYRP